MNKTALVLASLTIAALVAMPATAAVQFPGKAPSAPAPADDVGDWVQADEACSPYFCLICALAGFLACLTGGTGSCVPNPLTQACTCEFSCAGVAEADKDLFLTQARQILPPPA